MQQRIRIVPVALLLSAFLLTYWCEAKHPTPILDSVWDSTVIQGTFNHPTRMRFAPDGSIFVAAYARIWRFDSCGNVLSNWAAEPSNVSLAIGDNYRIFVANYQAYIRVYDEVGNGLFDFGSYGSGNGQFQTISDILVASDGLVYVCDDSNRVQVFTQNGEHVSTWGPNGLFVGPKVLASDSNGTIFVADFPGGFEYLASARVRKFTAGGMAIGELKGLDVWSGSLGGVSGIAFDSFGNIFVVSSNQGGYSGRVQKFDPNGNFLVQWQGSVFPYRELGYPEGISVDDMGNIFISNTQNSTIDKYVQPFAQICPVGDLDDDCDVDVADYVLLQTTLTGPTASSVFVTVSCLANETASAGSYFSNGNDLRGFATQSGFSEADWSVAWTLDSKPVGSGSVAIFDPGQLESEFVITAPALAGDYVFRLTVTNPTTNTQATDTATLTLTP